MDEADTSLCENVDTWIDRAVPSPGVSDDHDDDDDDDDDDIDDYESVSGDYLGDDELENDVINIIDPSQSKHFSEQRIKSCLRSRSCTVCLYLVLVVVVITSTVALVMTGLLVVKPYQRVRRFQPALCTPVVTIRDNVDRRCSCGKGCTSQYPCVKVSIRIYPDVTSHENCTDDAPSWTSVLAEDESMLNRQCTYFPSCQSSRRDNEAHVRQYVHRYGVQRRHFPCLYNPARPQEVIRTRRFYGLHVIHGLLWPACCVLISAVLILVMARYRKH